MNHSKLVLPEHLNMHGALFGGYLLKWVDEFAYITASIEYPENRFVTIGLDNLEFKHPVQCGEILRFDVKLVKIGRSSIEYQVNVYGEIKSPEKALLFETNITFVISSFIYIYCFRNNICSTIKSNIPNHY